jgi:hypothetical protein
MTVHDRAIAKIRQLPESLVQEVNDFVDFLLMKHSRGQTEAWTPDGDEQHLVETGLEDYLSNLEDYEERLARGEIQW